MTAEERWIFMRDTIYSTVLSTFGKKERQNSDWFDENLLEMEPVINPKREALVNYKREQSSRNLAALWTARNNAKKTARRCASQYWMNLFHSIQQSADSGNTLGVYDGTKKALGASARKRATVKSSPSNTITHSNDQKERWEEHYQDLYSRENVVTDAAINSTPSIPVKR